MKFIGIDPLIPGQEGFELKREGVFFLKLYHEYKVLEVRYEKDFTVQLEKVESFSHHPDAPKIGDKVSLILHNADITSIYAEQDGNFEDIGKFELVKETEQGLEIILEVSGFTFGISAESCEVAVN